MGTLSFESVREAQREWAAMPLAARLGVVAGVRRRMAEGARELAEMVPTELAGALRRTVADTLGAEVLPVLAACRFLERESAWILRARVLGLDGRPVWLGRVGGTVERAPWGVVLVIAAGNYPLLLAGVQTMQALVAGNAVMWKPAPGTEAVAYAVKTLLVEAGLPAELLTVLESSAEAGSEAIAAGVDFVALTGSAGTGTAVLHQLAEKLTPAVMELSGCDAVFVLPGADLGRLMEALGFGLRFNGSYTCMAPRRVFLVGYSAAEAQGFEARLADALRGIEPVALPERTRALVTELVEDARALGGEIVLDGRAGAVTMIAGACPAMKAMGADVFAPVVSVMRAADEAEALQANEGCRYALSATVFGPEDAAKRLAAKLRVGNVLINDAIVPTADPRVPFGGRGRSGYGVTRGAEGLLAMTTPKTTQVRRGWMKQAYELTGAGHVELFAGLAALLYGGWQVKWDGLRRLIGAGLKLK